VVYGETTAKTIKGNLKGGKWEAKLMYEGNS